MKTKHFRHKRNNSLSDPQKNILRNFDSVNPGNSEDTSLLNKMDDYIKARVDLEDAESDPAVSDIKEMVRDMILDYHKKGEQNKDDKIFIMDNIQGEVQDNDLLEEIDKIKLEINNSNINEITGDWVKDWQGRQMGIGSSDSKTEEIRDYIISSVKAEEREPEIRMSGKKNVFRKYLLNYVSLSAAAVAGVFILIKTLIPAYNPEQLFNSNYEPMNVVRPVTRSYSTDRSDNFAAGIDSYKNRDYKNAEIEFSNAVLKNKSAIESCFFLGITHLELGNYNEAANLLTNVTNQPGEYRKDAEWYLGLVYLKTGEKEKALSCFDFLAKAPGYYRERADKILRHLR